MHDDDLLLSTLERIHSRRFDVAATHRVELLLQENCVVLVGADHTDVFPINSGFEQPPDELNDGIDAGAV